jgi:phospholipid-translocating ATPase
MSDIPLRYIRRTRGYNPINNNDSEGENDNPGENSEMRSVEASAAAAMRRKSKGKVKARYVDDPEEEDSLLGGVGEDEGYRDRQEDLEEGRSETASQVCFILAVCEVALISM